jgi:hypothetical protein
MRIVITNDKREARCWQARRNYSGRTAGGSCSASLYPFKIGVAEVLNWHSQASSFAQVGVRLRVILGGFAMFATSLLGPG